MAAAGTKKGKPPKQTRIPGTEPNVPQAVQDKADEYVKALRARQRQQEKEGTLRAECLELMKAHKLDRLELDDERVLVVESKGEKLAIKKREDAPPAKSPDQEEEEAEE